MRTVGVLGAGQMGLGIAQASARAGYETVLVKATPGSLDAQRSRTEKTLQKEVELRHVGTRVEGLHRDALRGLPDERFGISSLAIPGGQLPPQVQVGSRAGVAHGSSQLLAHISLSRYVFKWPPGPAGIPPGV